MKKLTFILTLILLALTLQATEPTWEDLFDGKSLDGWERHGGKATYKVVDGTIVGTSTPHTPNTFLCTKKEYADFALEYEYFPHPTLNCGVQFRSQIRTEHDQVWGYQCEIDPSKRKWSAGVYEEGGRGWLYPVESARGQAAFVPGKWNKVRIVCHGPVIRTYLNGVAISELLDVGHKKGIIGLQVHGVGGNKTPMEIRWRNIKIMELGSLDTAALLDGDTDTLEMPAPRGANILLAAGMGLESWQLRSKKVPWMSKYVAGKLQWSIDKEKGIAIPLPKAGSMDSRKSFGTQRIHVEFCTPLNLKNERAEVSGNSGIYLQGRYELQICNSFGLKLASNYCGGLYKQRAPDINAAKKPGEWQAYDIYFTPARFNTNKNKIVNARVSAKLNGKWIHRNVEIKRPTGGGDSENPLPRPLRLQEHQNPVKFRNVWISDIDAPIRLKSYDPRKKK